MSSFEELAGFLHRNPSLTNSEIAQIFTMWQGLNPTITDADDFELEIYSPMTRLRSTTVTATGSIEVSSSTRARGTAMFKKIPPLTTYLDTLTVATVGSFSFTPLTVLTTTTKFGCICIGSGAGYITIQDNTKLAMGTGKFGVAFMWNKTGTGTHGILCKRNIANTTNAGIEIWISGGTTINCRIADGTNTVLISATVATLNDGNWHDVIINVPDTGNLEILVDTVSKATQARGSVASINNSRVAYILARDNAGTIQDKVSGNVALLHWKKTEIFSSTQISNYHNAGIIDNSTSKDVDVTFFPFNGDSNPQPDETMGLFLVHT